MKSLFLLYSLLNYAFGYSNKVSLFAVLVLQYIRSRFKTNVFVIGLLFPLPFLFSVNSFSNLIALVGYVSLPLFALAIKPNVKTIQVDFLITIISISEIIGSLFIARGNISPMYANISIIDTILTILMFGSLIIGSRKRFISYLLVFIVFYIHKYDTGFVVLLLMYFLWKLNFNLGRYFCTFATMMFVFLVELVPDTTSNIIALFSLIFGEDGKRVFLIEDFMKFFRSECNSSFIFSIGPTAYLDCFDYHIPNTPQISVMTLYAYFSYFSVLWVFLWERLSFREMLGPVASVFSAVMFLSLLLHEYYFNLLVLITIRFVSTAVASKTR